MMDLFRYITDDVLLGFLAFTYENIVPNYGIAIILLTILIKFIFYPLSVKQFRSMKATQALQPEVKKIQEKYKKDPQKLHQETMRLWKENNANPLGGCLPTLIQIPIFIGVFYAVRSPLFVEMLSQPEVNRSFLWLSDLAVPDPTYLFPIFIGLAMYWSQKLMTIDPKQAKMFMFMPVIMAFFSIKMPGGVLLYWAAQTLISNLQQIYIFKQLDKQPVVIKN